MKAALIASIRPDDRLGLCLAGLDWVQLSLSMSVSDTGRPYRKEM